MKELMPGDRVLVFDGSLYKDDKSTPLSVTMKPATVIRRYGKRYFLPEILCEDSSTQYWDYPDLVDVEFDHRGLSKGHFTSGVKRL